MSHSIRRTVSVVCTLGILMCSGLSQAYQTVKVQGQQLMTDFDQDGTYTPFLVKGVGYNAIPTGAFPSEYGICRYTGMEGEKPQFECPGIKEYEDTAILDRDFPYIKAMNANTVRTWGKVTPQLMDKAQDFGLKVIAGYWLEHNIDFVKDDLKGVEKDFLQYVQDYKDHPALLMWVIGYQNETDLCHFQGGHKCDRVEQAKAYYAFINHLARQVKMIEGESHHPVMMISSDLGDIGQIASDEKLNYIDIHGCNVYRGPNFSNFFELYGNRSSKPLLISEFGSDAWFVLDGQKPHKGVERQDLQASFIAEEWDTLLKNTGGYGGPAIGGIVSPFTDSWWQYKGEWSATAAEHDTNYTVGFYTGPDGFTNPEWFGLTALQPPEKGAGLDKVVPRLAYTVMQHKFTGHPPQRPWQGAGNNKIRYGVAWNYTAGYHFTPLQDGRVTQLGGLFEGAKTVRLWNKNTGNLLAQAEVDSKNEWIYADVTPVAVKADETYTVAVYIDGTGGSHAYDIAAFPRTCGDVRIEGSTFSYGRSRPVTVVAHQMYGQVDVNFVPQKDKGNHAPLIKQAPLIRPHPLPANKKGMIEVKAEDQDNDPLTYTWIVSAGSIEGEGPKVMYIPPEVRETTLQNVVVLVRDGRGDMAYSNVLFEIVPADSDRKNTGWSTK